MRYLKIRASFRHSKSPISPKHLMNQKAKATLSFSLSVVRMAEMVTRNSPKSLIIDISKKAATS